MRTAEEIAADLDVCATWTSGPKKSKLLSLAEEIRELGDQQGAHVALPQEPIEPEGAPL